MKPVFFCFLFFVKKEMFFLTTLLYRPLKAAYRDIQSVVGGNQRDLTVPQETDNLLSVTQPR